MKNIFEVNATYPPVGAWKIVERQVYSNGTEKVLNENLTGRTYSSEKEAEQVARELAKAMKKLHEGKSDVVDIDVRVRNAKGQFDFEHY